ncbi:MAG: hypothetical protein ABUJ98_01260 [Hyphomicrobium sp.]
MPKADIEVVLGLCLIAHWATCPYMAQAKGVMEPFSAKTMRFSSQTWPAKSVQTEKTISIIVNPPVP